MKESTSKTFLFIGLAWVIIFSTIIFVIPPCDTGVVCPSSEIIQFYVISILLWNIPGIIFIIIGLINFNSSKAETYSKKKRI